MAWLLEGGVTRQDLSAEEFFDPSFATDFDDLAGFDDLFSENDHLAARRRHPLQ